MITRQLSAGNQAKGFRIETADPLRIGVLSAEHVPDFPLQRQGLGFAGAFGHLYLNYGIFEPYRRLYSISPAAFARFQRLAKASSVMFSSVAISRLVR